MINMLQRKMKKKIFVFFFHYELFFNFELAMSSQNVREKRRWYSISLIECTLKRGFRCICIKKMKRWKFMKNNWLLLIIQRHLFWASNGLSQYPYNDTTQINVFCCTLCCVRMHCLRWAYYVCQRTIIIAELNHKWASAWDFQQCGMCDQQSLRSACAYAQSDQSLCLSLEYSMTVKLLTEQHLEFLSLKGGCTGSSESTLVKMSNCWKPHATAQMV